MTRNVIWQEHEPALQPVDETVDHLRGLTGCPAYPGDLEWGGQRRAAPPGRRGWWL
jgi:hypothetical protein